MSIKTKLNNMLVSGIPYVIPETTVGWDCCCYFTLWLSSSTLSTLFWRVKWGSLGRSKINLADSLDTLAIDIINHLLKKTRKQLISNID